MMEKKSKMGEQRKAKLSSGILKKQTLLNNNSIVKNLNEKPKKSGAGVAKRKPAAVPLTPAPREPSPSLPQGCTPLMYACQQADERLVAEILRKEPGSVLKRDRTLKTALHYCFDNPTAATADRVVMAAPALMEARDQDGFTPLHLAVIQGNMSLVTFLLANNADVMALDNEKHSVVHWATVCGELEALRAVLSAGADPSTADIHGGYPLHYAAQMCGGASTGTGGGAGGARHSLEVLGALLRAATRVDALDGQGRQPLLWAASAGSAPAILALVKAGAAVEAADKDGLTALHCAASRGHTECIETLLTLCGARPDVIDSNGCTALHYAVTLGHADATALLLDHGSDPNRQDRKGRSPAHCGCAKGQLETVRMLGARNANVWLRNAKGDLPLHEAVASGRRELVKWLLEIRPSQINATNNDGRTLLHIAANTDNTDLCKILLDFGGEVNAILRTSKNILMTPLDCALHKGYRSTAKYLQMHGGLPASRIASRHVLVNQDTIPQLPVRHIKSTKINLRDNIAIERREIFEMSPSSTPKHVRYSSKTGSPINSSEYSSEEYEVESKRQREERRKMKKVSVHYKKHKLKTNQNSFSDGYESEKRRRSSRQEKSLSDSESNGHVVKKKNKRSKSEPFDNVYKHEKTSSVNVNKTKEKKSSDSDADKIVKKRRKTSIPKKESRSNSVSSESNKINKGDKTPKTKKIEVTNEESEKQLEDEKDSIDKKEDSDTKVNDLIENIENNIDKLDSVIDSRISDGEANAMSFIQTTLVTEAQVHVESHTSIENGDGEYKIVTVETFDNPIESPNIDEVKEESNLAIEYIENTDRENGEANVELKQPELVEHHAEILEEKVDSEFLDDELELQTRDGIIAIIPDIDIDLASNEDTMKENVDGEAPDDDKNDNDTERGEGFVQAIIGILPDEDQAFQQQETEESPDSVMGEPISAEVETKERAITLIDEVSEKPEDKRRRSYSSERHVCIVEQDSEEVGVSDVSGKSTSKDEDEQPDSSNVNDTQDDKGVQKVFSVSHGDVDDDDLQDSRSVKIKGKELYETQSYRVLNQDEDDKENMRKDDEFLMREIDPDMDDPDRFVKKASYTRRRAPSVSDNEMYNIIDSSGGVRRRRLKKKYRDKNRMSAVRSKSQNSDRDYESSFFVDSGFEPSPRFVYQNRSMSPRLVAYYEDRNASGAFADKSQTKIPKRKPGDKNAVDMTSVTQIVQTNMRRYFLERKIFQHLMDLKRIQIRSSKANEALLVKRAVDEYHRSSLVYVGAGRFTSTEYTYKNFEKFLYDSLRKLQKSGTKNLVNLPERAYPDYIDLKNDNVYKMDGLPDNPILCTSKTHRCYHAVHAYTGIPCSAYLPLKGNHHTMAKPGIKKGFLPQINTKNKNKNSQVTLELCHGNEKQMISLPAEKLDKNKRYYVTFTVKGSNQNSDSENKQIDNVPRNVKSV